MSLVKGLGKNYSAFYFLASLGAGGLSVSFFMYFMFMLDHSGFPMPTFEHIYANVAKLNLASYFIIAASILIVIFAILHFVLLFWNIKEYAAFKKTSAFLELKSSNAEVSLMALPLTFAMSINVIFVLGVSFVPNLWSVVEYLFAFSLVAFGLVGVWALRVFSSYFVRIISDGSFDFANNNNLSQMLSIFAFAMVGVGFAAPGAMSSNLAVSSIGLFFAIFFSTIAISLSIVKITLGLKSIFKEGISKEASVSLWIMVPILTILGITFIRMTFGFFHSFVHSNPSGAFLFVLTSFIVSLQIMFGLVGYLVMKKVGYFKSFIFGDKKSASSFSIICPGVAFFVFGMFFIAFGLVGNGVVSRFGIVYFVILAPFVYVQFKIISVFFRLNKKLLLA